MKQYDRTTKDGESAYQTAYNRRLRLEILNHYGGRCACCGESAPEFLAIDHKNGDGKAMRKIHGQGGRALYGLKEIIILISLEYCVTTAITRMGSTDIAHMM